MVNISEVVMKQREYFKSNETKNVKFRIAKLKKLQKVIKDNEETILDALHKDLNKAHFEGYETEVGVVLDELKYAIKKLRSWSKPNKVRTPFYHFLSSSYIYSEPYGVTLIMSPWNYPFILTIEPLIGAMAAGNCAVVKPSEYSTHTSKVISKIISGNFKEKYISVIEGGREVNENILKEEFDYIFFTGSPHVGQIVMETAAKSLTPLTLELGGKSPCIVDSEVDIKIAAKRIIWGKLLNSGQTCVAPDYIYVHKLIKNKLIECFKESIKEFFGENPKESPDFPRIINEKHMNRLSELINQDKVIFGGDIDKENKYISPTIMDEITWDDPVMKEEIFGPILPILEYEDIDQVIDIVNKQPKPLALYLFTKNRRIERKVLKNISYGGGCVNDTIVHVASPHLPFGGVGNSGMGAYGGKSSFDTFSNKKSIIKKSNLIDLPLRYPPYKNKLKLLKKVLK